MLLKQHLLHDSQTHSHQRPRHSDPYIEQLIQVKLGQATHQERQADLLELMQHVRHEQLHSHHLLQHEQLQGRPIMGLRLRPEVGDGRSIGSVWPMDEPDQFIRNPVLSQRAHSAAFSPPAFSPLDMFQQQQRASHEEQLREFERNLQLQEQLKRGFYDPEVMPFEQSISLPGGGPGVNADMVNAMARFQGSDIQDPNSQMLSASLLRSFGSGAHPHSHHTFAPNERNSNNSHFDGEGSWPENDSRMSNMQSDIQQLHLNAEQQREQQVDEDNSKRLLMELLHQKSNQQSTQPLNFNEGTAFEGGMPSGFFSGSSSREHLFNLSQHSDTDLNNAAGAASFASISGEQTRLRVAEEPAAGFSSSGRVAGRSNSRIVVEGESGYPGIMYNSNMSGKAFVDRDFSEVEGNCQVPKVEDTTKVTTSEIPESMSNQPGALPLDAREILTTSASRQSSHGLPGGQVGFFNEKIARSNSFTEEIANDRMPTVLSRGSDNMLLKRPPVSRPLSSHEGLSDLTSDPVSKGMNPVSTTDGTKREEGGNAAVVQAPPDTSSSGKKDMRFRRTNSCSDTDVPETSFIDMLKSNTKKPPQPEAHLSEIGDASHGGKSGKKKAKKGRQIDPALLGFKVTSNRIMMGEIQRIDD